MVSRVHHLLLGVRIGIALQWVRMSEGVLDVKGEVKDIASTRRNEHPIETFSSARLFESSGLKRQGFDSWMVGYIRELLSYEYFFRSGVLFFLKNR